jgi:hypothetical protein
MKSVLLITVVALTAVFWPLFAGLVPESAMNLVETRVGCWAIPSAAMLAMLLVYVAACVRFRSYWYLCVPPVTALFVYNGYIGLFIDAACRGRAM